MKKIVIVLVVVLAIFLLHSVLTDRVECNDYYAGYVFDDFILETLPDNITCKQDKTPEILSMSNAGGYWHLIYQNKENKVQAHKYICNHITDRYMKCEIWKPEMGMWVHI